MLRRIATAIVRAEKLARVTFGFGSYGLIAVTLGFVVLPLQRLAGRLRPGGEHPELRAQRTIHRATRGWAAFVRALRLIRVREIGTEALRRRPHLVVANHPSLIDSPLLTTCMPQADFVVSAEWTRNPFLRHTIAAAGYLRAETGSALVREAVARLRAGRSVVIYPEGSRTPPEGLRAFQRGVAHIALRAGCDVLPVVLRVEPRWMTRGHAFRNVPDVAPEWEIEVGAPIRPADHVATGESRVESARRLTAVLQEHFEKRWERGNR